MAMSEKSENREPKAEMKQEEGEYDDLIGFNMDDVRRFIKTHPYVMSLLKDC